MGLPADRLAASVVEMHETVFRECECESADRTRRELGSADRAVSVGVAEENGELPLRVFIWVWLSSQTRPSTFM